MLFSLSAVALFTNHFNYSTPTTKWFAKSAYTVYLIHGWVLTVVTFLHVQVLKACREQISFPDDATYSKSHLSSEGWLFLSFFSTTLLTLGICWPLASAIRQLPGLRDIL